MAGTDEPNKSGRKQWKAGPRTPIGRMGGLSLLTEDSCFDSQLVFAKRLLDEHEGVEPQSAMLGVYWLIRASEQGHEEATDILRECLETGKGISKHNISDVRLCITMPREEKISRNAARELFACLSQGEDYITSDQLLEALAKPGLAKTGKISKTQDNNDLPSCSSGEKLTEDVLVSAASHYIRGELPIVHRVLMLSSSSDRTQHTSRSGAILAPFFGYYSCIVKSIGDRPIRSLMPIDTNCVQTLFLLLVYSLFGLDGLIDALPTFLYYASLLLMIVTTCKILVKRWEFYHFKRWSNLLVRWGSDGINTEDAQWTNCYNNIYPCYFFLLSLIFNILLTPFVPIFNILHSEIVILSAVFALVTLYNFAWRKGRLDFLVILSFGTSLLASYPWELDTVVSKGWRFLDVNIPTFISHIVGNSIEFCLNFRVLFCFIKPALLIKMAARDRWRGFYYTFVPHLISLSWWQLAVISSSGATSFGLIRACLAVVGIILLVPMMGLAIVILPVAALLRLFLNTESILPISASFIGAAVSLIVLVYLNIRRSFSGRLGTAIQILLVLISSIVLITSHLSMNRSDQRFDEGTSLSYAQVKAFCSAVDSGNSDSPVSVPDGERCSTLNGVSVHWEGRILSARISKVHNPISSIIYYLPIEIQRLALCMFGVRYDDCEGKEDCRLPVHLSNKCHISNWNRYEYEIIISLASSRWGSENVKIMLKGDNNFKNFTRYLHHDDKIWFSGRLMVDIDVEHNMFIHLEQAGCLVCKLANITPVLTGSAAYSISDLTASGKYFLNFLFNPVIKFK